VSKVVVQDILGSADKISPFDMDDARRFLRLGERTMNIEGSIELVWTLERSSIQTTSVFLVASKEDAFFDVFFSDESALNYELPQAGKTKNQRAVNDSLCTRKWRRMRVRLRRILHTTT
jgi:hypothetical protein